ncbi:MAG TPA: hypothetical protein VFH95_13795 [Candidatus Kapabacteria bacterium]|nr:hypothetical protein [Candidatus Kapabacteria bacterium]
MKRLLLVVFFFMPPATNPAWAQGNSACPLKLPFEIALRIAGTYFDTTYSTDSSQAPTAQKFSYQESYSVRIDTQFTKSSYRFQNDSLTFGMTDTSNVFFSPVTVSYRIGIKFDTQTSAITDLSIEYSEDSGGFNSQFAHNWRVICDSFHYTRDSIVVTDPNFVRNVVALSDSSFWFNAEDVPPFYDYYSSLELISGTPQITGSVISPLSVSQIAASSPFSIWMMNNAIKCSFSVLTHPRTLEFYTPLGLKAASFEIAPGQSELSLPHLQSGLYFVRLDGAVLKVAVP